MRDDWDPELRAMLDSYHTEPPAPDWLEHTLATATRRPQRADYLAANWSRELAMLAACAVAGFWLGSASLTNDTQTSTVSFDQLILGPSALNEVQL